MLVPKGVLPDTLVCDAVCVKKVCGPDPSADDCHAILPCVDPDLAAGEASLVIGSVAAGM